MTIKPAFIKENVSLQAFNTFGIAVSARYVAHVTSIAELKEALIFGKENHLPLLPIGGGSNMLFMKDFQGLVLRVELKGISSIEANKDEVLVTVAAGEPWHELVLYTLQKGWYGLENLSLIPGCVGAAPMQNIGAYGVELKDSFYSLEAVEIDSLETIVLDGPACHFGYRESIFKNTWKDKAIITAVTFRLNKNPIVKTQYGAISDTLTSLGISNPTPEDVSKAVIAIRKSKLPDPAEIGNAGSFFKNPEITLKEYQLLLKQYSDLPGYKINDEYYKVPAGWLIERAGWKGHSRGTHGVHPKQALVLVNYGGASGQEVWQLALDIQESVKQQFGIVLTPEVNRI
jgi:UDP-N-acetylmuramate dehydrogenase